jgi:hypothetical protein
MNVSQNDYRGPDPLAAWLRNRRADPEHQTKRSSRPRPGEVGS